MQADFTHFMSKVFLVIKRVKNNLQYSYVFISFISRPPEVSSTDLFQSKASFFFSL